MAQVKQSDNIAILEMVKNSNETYVLHVSSGSGWPVLADNFWSPKLNFGGPD